MVVVKELAAELQVQLAAELVDALADLLGLGGEVFLIVKTDVGHGGYLQNKFLKTVYHIFRRRKSGKWFLACKKTSPIFGERLWSVPVDFDAVSV
jgi:hypothetical protein